ncbi:MAG: hypothetical protein JWP75_2953, partial [Frondihabitans sp.]|nr:hypothetical protein [Frondihabitans sp.]
MTPTERVQPRVGIVRILAETL